MSDVNCKLCGRKIVLTKSNYILDSYGSYVHKKCPKLSKIDTKDKKIYQELKDTILYYYTNYPSDHYQNNPLIWSKISQAINRMNKEYTYEEILYALHETVKEMNLFYGIGAVENRIDSYIAKKRKKDQIKLEKSKSVDFCYVDMEDVW